MGSVTVFNVVHMHDKKKLNPEIKISSGETHGMHGLK